MTVFSHGIITYDQPISNLLELNFNSDEFTSKHVGKHILFAGCSVTYGIGLEDFNKSWSKTVYNSIKTNETVSGYYNISYPGHSISLQVSLIFRYIEKYGKPDVIFFNMPSSSRTFSAENDQLFISQVTAEDEQQHPGSIKIAEHYNYEAYLSLHQYCKALGIRLVSFTWSNNGNVSSDPGITEKLFDNKFSSFYKSNISLEEFLEVYLDKNKGDNLLIGTDNQHPGYGPHAYFAFVALDSYYRLDF